MSLFDCARMAQEYAEWLQRDIRSESIDGVCVLTVPFLDRHRDYLQVYAKQEGADIVISDDGYVIRDLRISGLELDTDRRLEALNQILRNYGIDKQDDDLRVVTSRSALPQKKHDLIQAMLAIGDLIHLASPTVIAIFKEDVEKFLRDNDVPLLVDVSLSGESGLNHLFDFAIGGSRTEPEKYIRAISVPNREHIVELMFSWQDLREARPSNAMAYAILNDEGRTVSAPLLDALQKYEIGVIPWSERESKIRLLQPSLS